MPGGLFIVNQVGRYGDVQRGPDGRYLGAEERGWLAKRLGGRAEDAAHRAFVEKLEAHFDRAVAMARDDLRAIEGLQSYAGRGAALAHVPRLPDDVYDFDGLLAIDEALFGELST